MAVTVIAHGFALVALPESQSTYLGRPTLLSSGWPFELPIWVHPSRTPLDKLGKLTMSRWAHAFRLIFLQIRLC
jgi:hypothetical protein